VRTHRIGYLFRSEEFFLGARAIGKSRPIRVPNTTSNTSAIISIDPSPPSGEMPK
jgi:hypothetical protein